ALAIMADGDGRPVPFKAAIDVAVRPLKIGVIRHQMFDGFPIAARRDRFVSFDYVIGMAGGDVGGNCVARRPAPKLKKSIYVSVARCLIRENFFAAAVFNGRQVCNGLSDGYVLVRGSRPIRWARERPPLAKISACIA